MEISDYFNSPKHPFHKQYEAMRAYYYEGETAEHVASRFGYTVNTVYSLAKNFRKLFFDNIIDEHFFATIKFGRHEKINANELREQIVALRKKYLSVEDIKQRLDSQNKNVSEVYIYRIISEEGFAKLPRRGKLTKQEIQCAASIIAPEAKCLNSKKEAFVSPNCGLLCFIPLLKKFGIEELMKLSKYPETKTLPKINSLLSFVALKLSNVKRYTKDDLWCMDRGLGLFAGLNVLPKAAWFTSYSHRVTRKMNIDFLRSLHKLWIKNDLVSDTTNLDFTTIPYWGDSKHLENNWSGKRHHALPSILAAIAQDSDSGIITYGDADVRHEKENGVVVEFLDFYKTSGASNLKYLVFDSKFTTYENLRRLDEKQIKFLTIRRRGKKIVEELNELPKNDWKTIRVMAGDGQLRRLKTYDKRIYLKDYKQEIRQVAITGNGKIKPALIITNDFDLSTEEIVRKYARRWLVEKSISEQTHFFHLNKVSSSMVIKVDFDLTMTILAYNLYRLLAMHLPRYTHHTAEKLYDKFINNGGKVLIDTDIITISLKKKRNLPAVLEIIEAMKSENMRWLGKKLEIIGASHS